MSKKSNQLSLRLKAIQNWGSPWGDSRELVEKMKRYEHLDLGESYLSHQDVLEKIIVCRWMAHLLESDQTDDMPNYKLVDVLRLTSLELFLPSSWLDDFKKEKPWEEMKKIILAHDNVFDFFKETWDTDLEQALSDFQLTYWNPEKNQEKIGYFWTHYFLENKKKLSELFYQQSLNWSNWLKEFPLPISPLFSNTATLGQKLGLNEKQCEYWAWVEILINQGYFRKNGLNDLFKETIFNFDFFRINPFIERFSKCIAADFNELSWLLSSKSPLVKMGWLKEMDCQNKNEQWDETKDHKHYWYYLAENWSRGHESRAILYRFYPNEQDILLDFIKPLSKNDLNLEDWNHLDGVSSILKALEYGSKNQKPCQILLWGPPGTGKTSLANTIFKNAGLKAITLPVDDMESTSSTQKNTLNTLYRTQYMGSILGFDAMLVDECEHFWKKEDKALLVDYMDNLKLSQIWIANDVKNCHPAWLRRFDLIVEIKEMPLEKRVELAQKTFEDRNLAHRVAQSILTPAGIVGAGQWCQKSEEISWVNVYRYLTGQQKMLKVIESKDELPLQVLHPQLGQLPPLAGYPQLKELQRQWVDIQEYPDLYKKMKVTPPKGIFLSGPPGTGKTLFAQHIAAQMSIPLLVGSSAIMAKTPKLIREVFQEARSKSPCVLFLDEADVLFPIPLSPNGEISTEKQTILNQMLTELDGAESLSGVLVIAATYHHESDLDPAAFRSGRLSEKVTLLLPNQKDRQEILQAYLSNRPCEHLNMDILSQATVSMTGADIKEVVEKASMFTVRSRQNKITQSNVEKAADEVFWGVGYSDEIMQEEERYRTAVHETGHALLALAHHFQVPRVTIRPRAEALGITQWHEGEGVYGRSKEKTIQIIEMMLGGLAAEEVVLGNYHNGGRRDLDCAKEISRRMLSSLGYGQWGAQAQWLHHLSERSLILLEDEEKTIQANAYLNAKAWLEKNQDLLKSCAQELLLKKELSGQSLQKWKEKLQGLPLQPHVDLVLKHGHTNNDVSPTLHQDEHAKK